VVLLRLCVEELPTEAVLKPPHSKRWRDSPGPSNRAKRLECGAFTAAFPERGCGEDQPQRVRAEELAEILQTLAILHALRLVLRTQLRSALQP